MYSGCRLGALPNLQHESFELGNYQLLSAVGNDTWTWLHICVIHACISHISRERRKILKGKIFSSTLTLGIH